MKKGFLLLTLLVYSLVGNAQQDAIYSQYMYNHFILNPAYAGSRNAMSGVLMHRTRWVGMDGAPTTSTLSVHSNHNAAGLAWGANLAADRLGPTRNIQFAGTAAYHLRMKKGKLAFGLRLGAFNSSVNAGALEFKDQADIFNTGNRQSVLVPSADLGLYYYTRKFYFSFSSNHVNRPDINLDDWAGANFALQNFTTIGMGYAAEINENLTFRPSILLKGVNGTPANLDINFSALLYKKVWFGIGFRNQTTLSILLDVNITDYMRVGYAYDAFLNRVNLASSGAHEIFIGFDLNTSKEAKTVSTRYL